MLAQMRAGSRVLGETLLLTSTNLCLASFRRPNIADIWNMRTWGWATLPHWTEADKRRYLEDRLCPACRRRGVQTVEAACERCTVRCTVTKRRGRPPGIKVRVIAYGWLQGERGFLDRALTRPRAAGDQATKTCVSSGC